MTDADQSKADEARLEEVWAKLQAAHEAVDAEYRLARDESWAACAKDEAARAKGSATRQRRQRRQRERRKQGLVILNPEVPEHEFAEALIVSGRKTEGETANRKLLTKALAEIARDFIERWTRA